MRYNIGYRQIGPRSLHVILVICVISNSYIHFRFSSTVNQLRKLSSKGKSKCIWHENFKSAFFFIFGCSKYSLRIFIHVISASEILFFRCNPHKQDFDCQPGRNCLPRHSDSSPPWYSDSGCLQRCWSRVSTCGNGIQYAIVLCPKFLLPPLFAQYLGNYKYLWAKTTFIYWNKKSPDFLF